MSGRSAVSKMICVRLVGGPENTWHKEEILREIILSDLREFSRSELMVIWKGWFEAVPCRATLATPFPALCPRILGTRFTNYGLRMLWGELMVIWKGWFETVPCRATLNPPFSALCPRTLGTRFTNYGLRVSESFCRLCGIFGLPQNENNHKGGTVTGGYGFGYVSDLYPSPFWYVSISHLI